MFYKVLFFFSPHKIHPLLYKGVPRKPRSSDNCSTDMICRKTCRQGHRGIGATFPAKTCIFLLSTVFWPALQITDSCFSSGKATGCGDNLSASATRLRPHVHSLARDHIMVVNKAPGLRYLYITARSNSTEALRFRHEMHGFQTLLPHIWHFILSKRCSNWKRFLLN